MARLHLWLLMPAAAVASLWLGWAALAAADFLYPAWYHTIGLHEHIERFAPQNRYRQDFEKTTPAERVRLFGEIVEAIHADGRGLGDIRYRDPEGRDLGPLLHDAEIVHLKDVARLVSAATPVGWLAVLWTLVHLGLVRRRGWPVPSTGRLVIATLAVVGLGVAALLVVGFRDVFYALHEAIFPPDHQWFFYYQDSLMSTMMKAPWLFAAIGAALLGLAMIIYLGILALASRLSTPAVQAP
jgi:hypothetical protein